MTDERETARALGISVQAAVDNGRQIVFQTHVDVDMSAEDLDKLLDKLNLAADRQAAFYEIPALKKAVRLEEDRHHLVETNLADVDKRIAMVDEANSHRRSRPEKAKDAIDRENAVNNLKRQKEIIAEVRGQLVDAERRAGKRYGGTDSAANS